jgi:hypothetical protein
MAAMGFFSSRFLREIWQVLPRVHGAEAVLRARAQMGERLYAEGLERSPGLIELEAAEELQVGLEATLTEAELKELWARLAGRALADNPQLVVGRDLLGTVQRLRGWLLAPFVDVTLVMQAQSQSNGFELVVGVGGRPRATRLLGAMALGAVLAAERFALESRDSLDLTPEVLGDRYRLQASYRSVRESEEEVLLPPAVIDSRPPRSSRPSGAQVSLASEVEEILAAARRADGRPLGFGRQPEQRRVPAPRYSPSGVMLAQLPPGPSAIAEGNPPSGVFSRGREVVPAPREPRAEPPVTVGERQASSERAALLSARHSPSRAWHLRLPIVPKQRG